MESDLVLVLAVSAAFVFAFSNGLGDAPALLASALSTRVAAPGVAVGAAVLLVFAGAFLTLAVAVTVAERIFASGLLTPAAVFCGVAAGIAWNALGALYAVPSSSTHALIGGLLGSSLALAGTDAVLTSGLIERVVVPALVAPLLAFALALAAIALSYRVVGRLRPGPVNRGYRLAGAGSGALLALAHGSNDAQKTMGVIALAMVAAGSLDGSPLQIPLWVVAGSALALALGTWAGGGRMLRGGRTRVVRLDTAQGFCAQGAGAAVILTASGFGFPVSTTHVASGALVGAGAGRRLSAERWGVAGRMLAAWLITVPAAAGVGAALLGVSRVFGVGAAGPVAIVIAIATLALATVALVGRGERAAGR